MMTKHPDCLDGCKLKEHKGYHDCISVGVCFKLLLMEIKETNMTKQQRLNDLKARLRAELPARYYNKTIELLDKFVKVYTLKQKADNSHGLQKLIYTIRAIPFFRTGLLLDIELNQTLARDIFKQYQTGLTLTSTLKNIQKKAPHTSQEWSLAVQICEVLNDYEPGHC